MSDFIFVTEVRSNQQLKIRKASVVFYGPNVDYNDDGELVVVEGASIATTQGTLICKESVDNIDAALL